MCDKCSAKPVSKLCHVAGLLPVAGECTEQCHRSICKAREQLGLLCQFLHASENEEPGEAPLNEAQEAEAMMERCRHILTVLHTVTTHAEIVRSSAESALAALDERKRRCLECVLGAMPSPDTSPAA